MTKFPLLISIPLLIICFSLPHHTLSQSYGPITISSSMGCGQMEISDDGETLLCAITSGLNILLNNGSNFEVGQTLTFTETSFQLSLAQHGNSFVVGRSEILELFEKAENGAYVKTETIDCQFSIASVQISEDQEIIAAGSSSGTLQIHRKNSTTGSYYLSQEMTDSTAQISLIQATSNFSVIATSGDDSAIEIYENDGSSFSLSQTIAKPYGINQMKISETELVFAGSSSNFTFYQNNGSGYILTETVQTPELQISRFGVTEDFSTIAFGGFSGALYIYKRVNGSFSLDSSLTTGDLISYVISDSGSLYLVYSTLLSEVKLYYECPVECLACSFPNNCSACMDGYFLDGGQCLLESAVSSQAEQPSHCVNNVFVADGVCKDYCHRKCKTCTTSKYNCSECAEFYKKNKEGECVIQDTSLSIFVSFRPFLNLVRKKGMKSVFMVIDDLWLYQYHKKKYEGTVKVVFKTISFVEEKQWEIVGLSEVINKVEDEITETKKYNAFSNRFYLHESRKTNFLIDTILDFLLFYVPFTLILVFFWNKVFYLLFHYRISAYLRPYSFWLIVADLLIQNNIEFFTFLGCRSIDTMFSFSFTSKALNAFSILFIFIIISCVAYSYLLYYYKYGKLARYFLVNMYRFPSSYVLMIITFGARPFLKGVVHAMFHENWQVQLWVLSGVEFLIITTIVLFQIILDNHKSRLVLVFDLLYSSSLIGLNTLLLFQYKYLVDKADELQIIVSLLIYFMLILIALRLLVELKNYITDCIECACYKKFQVGVQEQQAEENQEQNQNNQAQNALGSQNRAETQENVFEGEKSIEQNATNNELKGQIVIVNMENEVESEKNKQNNSVQVKKLRQMRTNRQKQKKSKKKKQAEMGKRNCNQKYLKKSSK